MSVRGLTIAAALLSRIHALLDISTSMYTCRSHTLVSMSWERHPAAIDQGDLDRLSVF